MGAWGSGLYSSDFACDLRSTIAALARLPVEGDQLLQILGETETNAANDPADEDHTTFWLVAADQFHKRGIDCAQAVKKACSIIDSATDTDVMRKLGMSEPSLRKRAKKLAELRQRLAQNQESKRRQTLTKPQRYMFEIGDVLAYPTCVGDPINPYGADAKKLFRWVQDGWAAMVVVNRGRAFDYLAWYTVVVSKTDFGLKPSVNQLSEVLWLPRGAGTCSPVHFKRMELECIGRVSIKHDAPVTMAIAQDGSGAAILDVSIANCMDVQPRNGGKLSTKVGLERLPSITLGDVAATN